MSTNIDEMDVLSMSKIEYNDYCCSPEYHVDFAAGLAPSFKATAPSTIVSGDITSSEFCRGFKRDKTHYSELKEERRQTSSTRGTVDLLLLHSCIIPSISWMETTRL
jgi:hypothetical protein